MNDTIYADKLHRALVKAGIHFNGVGQNGIVYDMDGKTEMQNRADIKKIAATIADPLESARGKHFNQLQPKEKDLLLLELFEQFGITIDGIVQ